MNKKLELRGIFLSACNLSRRATSPLKNENGFALILALSMLAIMSLLVSMALNTANMETGISGNYRTAQLAFDSAQRAVEYASTKGDIYTSLGLGPGSAPYDLDDNDGDGNDGDDTDEVNIKGGTNWGLSGTDNYVAYQMAAAIPPGSGSDPTYFEAHYYIVNVTGAGPRNSLARVEAQVGRIVPK